MILDRPGWSLDSLLEPHNEHVYLGPVVVYKALLGLFGMESTLPFRIVNTLLLVVIAGLVFAYVRGRLGGWIAVIAASLILFLGPAWEDLLWPAGISFLGSIAAGVAALVALERWDPRGDRWACALLIVSLCFSSLGLVFAAGAALDLVLGGERRLRRAYVAAIPVALYGAWFLAYGSEAESAASLDNLLAVPIYVWSAAGAALASLAGLALVDPEGGGAVHNLEWGRPLAVVAVVASLWLVARRPAVRSRRLWVLVATAGVFWALAGLNEIPGREPGASRYQLIGGVLLILIAAELLRGRVPGRGWTWVVAAFAAAAIVSNVGALRDGERFLRSESELATAELAALEIARDHVDPAFTLDEDLAGTPYLGAVSASAYLAAVEDWGSPVDRDELAESPEAARLGADRVLAAARELELEPVSAGGAALTAAGGGATGGGPTGRGPAEVALPPGGAVLAPQGGPVTVRLRRYAEEDHPVELGAARGETELAIPIDDSSRPWLAELRGPGPTLVCARGSA